MNRITFCSKIFALELMLAWTTNISVAQTVTDDTIHAPPLQVGQTFFERAATNSAQYPLLPALRDVSVTTNLLTPYRLRSFLGGMLWGTGEPAEYYNWSDVPPDRKDWYKGHWRQIRLDQQTVYLNPVMVNYNWPPGQFGNDPALLEPNTSLADGGIYNGYSITNFVFPPEDNVPPRTLPGYTPMIRRGINLGMPFPYLTVDRGRLATLPGDWARSPLQLQTRPIETFVLVPSNLEPDQLLSRQAPGHQYVTSAWTPDWAPGQDPPAILVDRMGDWDADLIYQDPISPYVKTDFGDPGLGRYLKFTIANGSPFVWCEMNDVRYGLLYNAIHGKNPARQVTAPAALPGLPDVQYVLVTGDQDDPQRAFPGVPPEPSNLNPAGAQHNYTTAAIYWYRVNPRADDHPVAFESGTDALGDDFAQLDFGPTPGKVFFVIALLPVQSHYPAAGRAFDEAAARAYAEGLGQHAFNFVTGTRFSYSVAKKSVAELEWTSTLGNPYGLPGLVASSNTVQALLPHQYQSMSLGPDLSNGGSVVWNPLVPGSAESWSPSIPAGSDPWKYWTVRGSLATYLGTVATQSGELQTSFRIRYLHNNFLAAMPPPDWSRTITAPEPNSVAVSPTTLVATPLPGGPRTVAVSQILIDDIAQNYLNNVAYGNRPWGTFFERTTPDSYGLNQAFTRIGQQLGTLQLLSQYRPTYVDQPWFNAGGPPPFYAQPNSRRPGVNPVAALEDSVRGLQDAISRLFGEKPAVAVVNFDWWPGGQDQNGFANIVETRQPNLWNLEYFVRWEKEAGRVLVQPNGSFPAFFFPTRSTNMAGPIETTYPPPALVPQRDDPPLPKNAVNVDPPQTQPTDQSGFPYYPGTLWDGFGIATSFNDHHYNLGYLIAGASLATIYDGAWTNTPTPSAWADRDHFGPGIDAIIQTLGNDPDNVAFQAALYTPDEMRLSFPKFSFFDLWAGHPWASGLTPGDGLQKFGMNENSSYEGNQAWSGTVLWGMATDRPAITDLGIVLYTLGSFTGDFYIFDKNGNTVPGNPWSWVPVTTGPDVLPGGTYNAGMAQHDANPFGDRGTPVGTATEYQGANSVANFFGAFPQGSRLIQAYPATPWHLAIGRNAEFMRRWADELTSPSYQQVNIFPNGGTPNFVPSYSAAMDQIVALGGMDHPSSIAPFADPAGKTPLMTYWANMMLGDGSAPNSIGAAGQILLQPSQTCGTMLHWLVTLDTFGLPDFTLVGHAVADSRAPASTEDSHVFTAAFTRVVEDKPKTSLFAFNPGSQPVAANFWRVTDEAQTSPLLQASALIVPPKQWARAEFPSPPKTLLLRNPRHDPERNRFLFTVDTDSTTVLIVEKSSNLVDWVVVPLPLLPTGTTAFEIGLGDYQSREFYRVKTKAE